MHTGSDMALVIPGSGLYMSKLFVHISCSMFIPFFIQAIQIYCLSAAHWLVLGVARKEAEGCITQLCCDGNKKYISI